MVNQPSEKEDFDFEPENRQRLIDGEIQNTWLLLHPWPTGQDTLDIDFEERVLERREERTQNACFGRRHSRDLSMI